MTVQDIDPIDHKWISDDAKELFEHQKSERDRLVMEMHRQLGDIMPESEAKASVLKQRPSRRQVIDPVERDKIMRAWEPLIRGYENLMAKTIREYSYPIYRIAGDETEKKGASLPDSDDA